MIAAHYADIADRFGHVLAHIGTSATFDSSPMRRGAEWAVYQCVDAFVESEVAENPALDAREFRRAFRRRVWSVRDVALAEARVLHGAQA